MELPRNAFKHALAAGDSLVGLWCSMPDPYSIEGLSLAGFDWMLFDTEHAPADPVTVLPLLQAAAAGTAAPLVRPAANDPVLIKRMLDIGAQTLLIPYIQSVEDAQNAVRAMHYPPAGVRGVAGLTRATRYGRVANYTQTASSELCCLLQIETLPALEAIEEIAAIDGVDGLFIGPSDLAASLGYPGNAAHPLVQDTIDEALQRIRAAGKPSGILALNEEDGRRYLDAGCNFVAVGSDLMILMRGADALAARFKTPKG